MCNDEHVPDDLDGVSEATSPKDPLRVLLERVTSPASVAELGDVDAAVAVFRSGLASPASGTVQGSRAVRRRVPRRALGVVVGTLLVAGTAAAAATQVLPSWIPVVGHDAENDSLAGDQPDVTDSAGVGTDVDESLEDPTVVGTSPVDSAGTPSIASVPEQSSRDWGWCHAWSKGGGAKAAESGSDRTVTERLAVLAVAEGLSVEDFCAEVLASSPNQKDPGKGSDGTVNGNGNHGNGHGADTTAP